MLLQQEVGFDMVSCWGCPQSYSTDTSAILWACAGGITLLAMSNRVVASGRRMVAMKPDDHSSVSVPERFESPYLAIVGGLLGVTALWAAFMPDSWRYEPAPGEMTLLWLSFVGFFVAPILLLSGLQRVVVRFWRNEDGAGILSGALVGVVVPIAWLGEFDLGATIGFCAVGAGIGALNCHVRSLPWGALVWMALPVGVFVLIPVGKELVGGLIRSLIIVATALIDAW